jgi:hypothetical protein
MIRRSRSVVSSCCSACRALITIRVCAISGSAGCYVGAVRRSESRQHRCRLPPWPGAPFRQRWPAPPRRRVARGVQKWSAKVPSAECGVPRQRVSARWRLVAKAGSARDGWRRRARRGHPSAGSGAVRRGGTGESASRGVARPTCPVSNLCIVELCQ